MNVQKLVLDSFYFEWMRLCGKAGGRRRRPSFLTALDNRAHVVAEVGNAVQQRNAIVDLEAVQKKIDGDLQGYKDIERRRRSRFHRLNIRFLSRLYAHKLFAITKGASPNSESMREALRQMRGEIQCPFFPCLKSGEGIE
jgi:hypothetical protein